MKIIMFSIFSESIFFSTYAVQHHICEFNLDVFFAKTVFFSDDIATVA